MRRANVDMVLDACGLLHKRFGKFETIPGTIQSNNAHMSNHGARIFVSAEMVELTQIAAQNLPDVDLVTDEIPWTRATVVAESSFFSGLNHDVTMLQWVVNPATNLRPAGVETWYFGTENTNLECVGVSVWEDGLSTESEHAGTNMRHKFLYVLWSFLRDRIALAETQPAPKASYRRWERATGKPPEDIVVITLRRPTSKKPEDANVAAIDWTHQWVVDGHWRNQWYPATQRHRPKWIAAHIKGPEDKPLVVKERIYAWTR